MLQAKTNSPHTAAVILSGGLGTRIGGLDKGLQDFNGKPMIAWVIDAIQPQVDSVVLSINRNKDQYRQFGVECVFDAAMDPMVERHGPIAGILAGTGFFSEQNVQQFLIACCDSPMLNKNYVSVLTQALTLTAADVAVVNDGERNQNLHCLIDKSAIASLRDYYQQGGRAMHRWLQQVNLQVVDFSDQAKSFRNFNTTADINALT